MSRLEASPDAARRPLVTIAIPTFNRAPLLGGCIQAALAQTYENIEVLVSNNASSDDTQKVLREFDDKRLRVLTQETNIGLQPNWNACLDAAKGEYVVVVSDDDRISPWFLSRCIEIIEQQPRIPIVVALSNFHLSDLGQTRPPLTSRLIGTGVADGTDILLEFLKDEITVAMCGILLRTDVLRSEGGFPLDYPHTGDVAAWAPILCGSKAGFVNEACATYNFHCESETAKLSVTQILVDGWRVASLISRMADERIEDERLRELVKLEARRGFARRGLAYLAHYRSNGASLNDVSTFVWRFWSNMIVVDKPSLIRFIAIVLCPRPLAEGIRYVRQLLAGGWRDRPAAVKL